MSHVTGATGSIDMLLFNGVRQVVKSMFPAIAATHHGYGLVSGNSQITKK
jgi:hypothetical protein